MMRRLLLLLVILLMGCSGGPGTAATAEPGGGSSEPTTPPAESTPPSTAAASEGSAGGGVLPGACESGFAKYLDEIEPIVAAFDPAAATLGDFSTAKQAVQEKSVELLMANNATAPYSCSEAGLEWAYFDSNTPWEAVLAVAEESAPGTVAYLTAVRDMAAIDVATVGDYGVEGCEAAVASIKERVAAELSGGAAGAEDMALEDGLALLGLYKAYMRDVQTEACPRDALGNDEFGFFGSLG